MASVSALPAPASVPAPASTLSGEKLLLAAIEPLRAQLREHPLYSSITSLEALRTFMESHVYAVWDFMSLLKALQRSLTCVEVPWRPTADATARRLINEIVLGEESDLYEGTSLSHFELYLQAMRSCGADTTRAAGLVRALESGRSLQDAFGSAPEESRAFVEATFATLTTGQTHRIAAAFTFGREDLIPAIFSAFICKLDEQLPGRIAPFRYYLERHIEMDGDEHGPMALEMLRHLCRSEQAWQDASEAATHALEARIALWDGIYQRIERARR